MGTSNVNVYKIKQKLSKIPQEKLKEVDNFIEFILTKSKVPSPKIIEFEGIWKGLGFEQIKDLEFEIHQIREEATQSISNRISKWNI